MNPLLDTNKAVMLADDRDELVPLDVDQGPKPADELQPLAEWILTRLDGWRQYRDSNFAEEWDECERLWLSIYSDADKLRKSERSKIMTPALAEAIENCVAEVEEAVFGRGGDFFDMTAGAQDNEVHKVATERNKISLKEDLSQIDYIPELGECLINGAVYGTGIGEILTKSIIAREIGAIMTEAGPVPQRVERKKLQSVMRSVNPRNFLIDPNAKKIEDLHGVHDGALGCAIEEYVGTHIINDGMKRGDYRKVDIALDSGDQEILPDRQQTDEYNRDKTHVYRYYGLVPRNLLFPPETTTDLFGNVEEVEPQVPSDEETVESEMVEAIVVIANKSTVLKAVENPNLMQDRNVVAFQWDVIPGRFWGRGVGKKGSGVQLLLDAEFRARMDALAFSQAPLMGIDASRLPRGFKLEVFPGNSIPTNGDPSTALKPFKFGEVDQNTYQQADALDKMLQRATGSLDTVAMAQAGASGEARTGAVSMSLSGIMKRHKRTLMRFIDGLLVPSLRKLMWRNMQYKNPRYVPLNFTFKATNTIGIMQREYEAQSITQLMQTIQPGSKEYLLLLKGAVLNTGLQNRHEIVKAIDETLQALSQPVGADAPPPQEDPQILQMKLQAMMAEIEKTKAEVQNLASTTRLNTVKAEEMQQQAELQALQIASKGIYAIEDPKAQEAVFEQRLKLAQLALQKQDIESNERIAEKQMGASNAARMAELAQKERELSLKMEAAERDRLSEQMKVLMSKKRRVKKNPDGSFEMELLDETGPTPAPSKPATPVQPKPTKE